MLVTTIEILFCDFSVNGWLDPEYSSLKPSARQGYVQKLAQVNYIRKHNFIPYR